MICKTHEKYLHLQDENSMMIVSAKETGKLQKNGKC